MKICKWCGKEATHVTSKGIYVCALCNGNPALTKWKKVSRYSRIMVDVDGNAALAQANAALAAAEGEGEGV